MEKPDNVSLKRCIVCGKMQTWDASLGCVITKGWHGIDLKTAGNPASTFSYRFALRFPVNHCHENVVCEGCIPAALEKYIEAAAKW